MKHSFGDKVFYALNNIGLALIALTCFLPLLHITALSLSEYTAIVSGFVVFWPVNFSLDNYTALINGTNIMKAFVNSVVITVTGVALSMIFTTMAAYPLSRSYCYGRRMFTLAIVFTMLFQGGMIPTFLLIKSLGLVNSYGAIWGLSLISAFNMLIMRSFFQNIPEELMESARIDGSGEWRSLISIVLPLSMPMVATLCLFYGVHYWNSFMSILIYINDTDKLNMTVIVQNMVRSQRLMQEIGANFNSDILLTPEGVKSAGVLVLIIPMLLVYPFLQRYFVKGIMLGSIKG